jgi:hypothetical protein
VINSVTTYLYLQQINSERIRYTTPQRSHLENVRALAALPGIDSFSGINKYGTLWHTAVPIAQANQYGQLLLPSKSVTA